MIKRIPALWEVHGVIHYRGRFYRAFKHPKRQYAQMTIVVQPSDAERAKGYIDAEQAKLTLNGQGFVTLEIDDGKCKLFARKCSVKLAFGRIRPGVVHYIVTDA
jgi:hypothetical protein